MNQQKLTVLLRGGGGGIFESKSLGSQFLCPLCSDFSVGLLYDKIPRLLQNLEWKVFDWQNWTVSKLQTFLWWNQPISEPIVGENGTLVRNDGTRSLPSPNRRPRSRRGGLLVLRAFAISSSKWDSMCINICVAHTHIVVVVHVHWELRARSWVLLIMANSLLTMQQQTPERVLLWFFGARQQARARNFSSQRRNVENCSVCVKVFTICDVNFTGSPISHWLFSCLMADTL